MATLAFAVFAPVQGYFLSFHDHRKLAYEVGHRGQVQVPDGRLDDRACRSVLIKLFTEGNGEGDGEGFTVNRRSMTAGDVVTIAGCGCWLCDSNGGWTEIGGTEAERFPVEGVDYCPVVDYAAGLRAARVQAGALGFRP